MTEEEGLCAVCQQPLIVEVIDSDEEEDYASSSSDTKAVGTGSLEHAQAGVVPDDLQPICGCHFHWECIFDAYVRPHQCPSCEKSIAVDGQVPCMLKNEGGIQQNYDLLPALDEHFWLEEHPQERECIAFLEFCRNGDIPAILELLADKEDLGGDEMDLLRYQYPLSPRLSWSALHYAVDGGREDVVWLLLYLASSLKGDQFPSQLLHLAASFGIQRPSTNGKIDIREMRDSVGRTAEDFATASNGLWASWIGKGLLSV